MQNSPQSGINFVALYGFKMCFWPSLGQSNTKIFPFSLGVAQIFTSKIILNPCGIYFKNTR